MRGGGRRSALHPVTPTPPSRPPPVAQNLVDKCPFSCTNTPRLCHGTASMGGGWEERGLFRLPQPSWPVHGLGLYQPLEVLFIKYESSSKVGGWGRWQLLCASLTGFS